MENNNTKYDSLKDAILYPCPDDRWELINELTEKFTVVRTYNDPRGVEKFRCKELDIEWTVDVR